MAGAIALSCSKDNEDGPIDKENPEDSKVKLTIKLPSSSVATRADLVGTNAENNIEDISIYVFDQQGDLADRSG